MDDSAALFAVRRAAARREARLGLGRGGIRGGSERFSARDEREGFGSGRVGKNVDRGEIAGTAFMLDKVDPIRASSKVEDYRLLLGG